MDAKSLNDMVVGINDADRDARFALVLEISGEEARAQADESEERAKGARSALAEGLLAARRAGLLTDVLEALAAYGHERGVDCSGLRNVWTALTEDVLEAEYAEFEMSAEEAKEFGALLGDILAFARREEL